MRELRTMYFSPTGTTERIIDEIEEGIIGSGNIVKSHRINFTAPEVREEKPSFKKEDILLIGVPVYAGRVPNVLLKYLNSLEGMGNLAIPIVLFGNRAYDDALIELNDILINRGFKIIAGAGFVGEHSFSYIIAKNRPDQEDLGLAREFGRKIYEKIEKDIDKDPNINGSRPYRDYYVPRNEDGEPRNIIKAKPKTDEDCIDCKKCAKACPMSSINFYDVSLIEGICIKCGSCVKICPMDSKYFDDPNYIKHKKELEEQLKERMAPEIFI